MVNDSMSVNQAATVFNAVIQQATGNSALAEVTTANFVSVAQTMLRTGYDPILNAISQVMGRTVFSVRPYTAKFAGMRVDNMRFGNMMRKLSIADGDFSTDLGFAYPSGYDSSQEPPTGNGKSVDMYVQKKPNILQTNFYSKSVFQDAVTVHKEQLDVAFRGPAEFGQFVSMIMGNMSDKLETARESISRALVTNFIGGIIKENNPARVVKLLTEYNAKTGQSLTEADIYLSANFKPFTQYVFSRVKTISSMMTERSNMYQTVIDGKNVLRHTPKDCQRMYLFGPTMYESQTMAIADVFNRQELQIGEYETVNYWQSIQTPGSINVKPSYVGTDGQAKVADTAVEQDGVFGLICDVDAIGYSEYGTELAPTPYNVAGRYTNFWLNDEFRALNDNTEKGVVLLLK